MERWSDSSLVRKLKRGLLGDESYVPGGGVGREAEESLPLAPIVEDLCARDERFWVGYAFSHEPMNGRLSDDQRRELYDRACSCGREQAARVREAFGTSDSQDIAQGLGAMVDVPERPQSLSRVLFAEFVEPRTIHVFKDGLDRAEEVVRKEGVRAFLTSALDVKSVLLAHETFHLVELQNKGDVWTQTYRLDLWGRFPIRNRSPLAVLSEIAAMAFARELTGLPYSPFVLDVVLTYAYSPQAGTALYRQALRDALDDASPEEGKCEHEGSL